MVTNLSPIFGYHLPGIAFATNSVAASGNVGKMLVAPDGSVVVIGQVPGGAYDASSGFAMNVGLWGFNSNGLANPRFGAAGMAEPVSTGNSQVLDATFQADGKMLTGGVSWNGQASVASLTRYNADGTLDLTFGHAGQVDVDFGGTYENIARVLTTGDGKILVAGGSYVGGSDVQMVLARYNSDGTPDTSFNATGKAIAPLGASTDLPRAIQVLGDGSVVVLVSSTASFPTQRMFDLLHYRADGTLDTQFGTGGIAVQTLSSVPGSSPHGLVVDASGKLVVYGTNIVQDSTGSHVSAFLMRFTADGHLDPSFGNQGTASTPIAAASSNLYINHLLEQPDGKLVIADSVADASGIVHGQLLRFNADGSIDTTFGDGGTVDVPLAGSLSDIQLTADGHIVAAGAFAVQGDSSGAFTPGVIRFDSHGSIDTSYSPAYPFARESIADVHGGTVEIAPAASVYDAESDQAGSYYGTSLTIARHGGAVPTDMFYGEGSLSFQNGMVLLGLGQVGNYTLTNGTLHITWSEFGVVPDGISKPTQALVDSVLQHITWQPGSQAAGTTAAFDVTFDDGSGASNASVTSTATVRFENVVHGSAADDSIIVNAPDQFLDGLAGNDMLQGSAFPDSMSGGAGNDTLQGGDGTDTALYSGPVANYAIQHQSDGSYVITDKTGAEGTDVLWNVERVQFGDARVALDVEGTAGQAYRLYQAAFNRTPDLAGLGYQINDLDHYYTLEQVAANFIASPEFQHTYGAVDNTQFITLLYQNVLHRAPDAGGLQFHLDEFAHGETRAQMLIHFSESPENQVNVVAQIQDGIIYLQ